jgi:hypothetical protein
MRGFFVGAAIGRPFQKLANTEYTPIFALILKYGCLPAFVVIYWYPYLERGLFYLSVIV